MGALLQFPVGLVLFRIGHVDSSPAEEPNDHSIIHYHWTPNHYLPAILGWLAALLVTVALSGLGDLLKRARWR